MSIHVLMCIFQIMTTKQLIVNYLFCCCREIMNKIKNASREDPFNVPIHPTIFNSMKVSVASHGTLYNVSFLRRAHQLSHFRGAAPLGKTPIIISTFVCYLHPHRAYLPTWMVRDTGNYTPWRFVLIQRCKAS